MKVLGLDFGGQCGFAVTSDGKTMRCGTIDLTLRAQQMRCSKSTAFWKCVRELIAEHGVEAVIWEDSITSFMGAATGGADRKAAARRGLGDALVSHAEYRAVITLIAETKNIRVLEAVANSTIKKFATGHGRAEKEDMIRAARQQYGVTLSDKDEHAADACHLAAFGVQRLKTAALPLW